MIVPSAPTHRSFFFFFFFFFWCEGRSHETRVPKHEPNMIGGRVRVGVRVGVGVRVRVRVRVGGDCGWW